ncbi:MAG: twin-arginine translocase subunit TatC [Pirellulaceae bacterium]
MSQAKAEFREANGQEPSDALARWIYFNKIMPERVFIDPHSLQEVPSQAVPPLESAAAEASTTKAVASDSAADEEAVGGESAPLPDEADFTELDRPNPWQGIDLAKLQRLQPFLLFRPIPSKLVALTITEGFMVWLKAGLVAGVVIASPGIFWHIWQFLAAGLYPHERRYVFWYLPLSLLLFLSGVALAFFAIFRLVLGFLMTYTAGLNVEFTPRLNEFMSFEPTWLALSRWELPTTFSKTRHESISWKPFNAPPRTSSLRRRAFCDAFRRQWKSARIVPIPRMCR